MVNGRQKGNAAEREIVKIFREWWGGQPWERRSMGYKGSDIHTPDDFPWSLEVKHCKQLRAIHLFKPTELLYGFLRQADWQAKQEGKKPLLVAKIEGVWIVIMLVKGSVQAQAINGFLMENRHLVVQTVNE